MGFKLSKIPYYVSHVGMYREYYHNTKSFENYVKIEKKMGLPCALVTGTNEFYLFGIEDVSIPYDMFVNKKTFPENEIRLFFSLTKEYYGIEPSSKDYFLDIGANIGTTSIFVKKNIMKKMNIIAFEPEPFNYKLLRANTILNDCDDIICANVGLSGENGMATMAIFPENRGKNQIVQEFIENIQGREKVEIPIITLDSYIENEKIDAENIKWLWIDTEGHEIEVLKGMETLLSKYRIPIFMEFNPQCYDDDSLQKMQDIFSRNYKQVISINTVNGEKSKFSVDKMIDFSKTTKEQYNVFLY